MLYRLCKTNFKTKAEAEAYISQLEAIIISIQNDPTINEELKFYLIRKYRGCIIRIKKNIIVIILSDPIVGDGSMRLQAAINYSLSNNDFGIQTYGYSMLLQNNEYNTAHNFINALDEQNGEQSIFKAIQSINLLFQQNPINYTLSTQDSNVLYSIGQQRNPYAGMARGLYYQITGERIPLSTTWSGGDPELRSNKLIAGNNITVSPNPTNGHLNIKIEGTSTEDGIDINIYSLSGEVVSSQKDFNYNTNTLNLENLNSGIYFISIRMPDNSKNIFKFVKI